MDPIRIRTPSVADAHGLAAALDGGFGIDVDGATTDTEVALMVDGATANELGELLDLLGCWLTDRTLDAVQIGFGERTYTLLAPENGEPRERTDGSLERTMQLQTAFASSVVIEQAKGIIAERESIDPETALDRIRRDAHARQIRLDVLAEGIVGTVAQRDGH